MTDRVNLGALLLESGNMEPSGFPPAWQALPATSEVSQPVQGNSLSSVYAIA